MMIKTVTALIGAATLLAGSPAAAEPTGSDFVSVTRRVSTADFNLLSAAGRRALDRRIAAAARAVCRSDRGTIVAVQDLDCFARALASAERQRDQLFALRGVVVDYRTAGLRR